MFFVYFFFQDILDRFFYDKDAQLIDNELYPPFQPNNFGYKEEYYFRRIIT